MRELPSLLHGSRDSFGPEARSVTYSMNRQAFTLIELLVVVAIITILASLLLPVLAAGKMSVRKTLCLSNQRQMSLATQMYADDYNGAFPKADNNDHTLWIKRMINTKNFSTLKIFEDPAEF